MTFLADESVDQQIIERLREHGYVVIAVVEMEPGVSDTVVLDLANVRGALLITKV